MRRRGVLATLGAVATGGCLGVLGGGSGFTDHREDRSLAFQDVTDAAGLDYSYEERGGGETMEMISNAGVYAADYDNDGLVDVLTLGGGDPVLWHNTGSGFERSGQLPTFDETVVTNALFFDHDNDGWEDLLLLPAGSEAVFLENDGGEFARREVGLGTGYRIPISAGAADATGNGYPDVFVAQNGNWNEREPKGYERYLTDGEDDGYPNRLFTNDGSGFTEVTEEAGITGERWSLATSFVDLTGDGLADIHVANDFNRDVLYRNNGDGTFERTVLGEATDRNGMASEVTDFDGDGDLDIFVTNIYLPDKLKETTRDTMQTRTKGNNLLLNEGNGTFVDGAEEFGVRKGGWGWAAAAVDFSNDGTLDLVHTAGYYDMYDRGSLSADEVDEIHERYRFYRYPPTWEGTEDGFEYRDPESLGFGQSDGRGLAHVDVDNDGRRDLVLADADPDGSYRLYQNVGDTGKALQVDVRPTETTTALGARVTVAAGEDEQLHVYDSKSDFLSQSSRILHFGVGDHDAVDVRVRWPDGTERTVEGVDTGQRVAVSPDGIADTLALE